MASTKQQRGSADTRSKVRHNVRQRGQLTVIRFWKLDPECVVEANEKVEKVKGINIQCLAHIRIRVKRAEIGFGRNGPEPLRTVSLICASVIVFLAPGDSG